MIANFPVFMFFPRVAPSARKGPTYLSEEKYKILYDGVIYPALRGLGADFTQHVPPTFDNARNMSRARQIEGAGNVGARGDAVTIELRGRGLRSVWHDMSRTLRDAEPGDPVYEFGEPLFVYNCKGTKLEFKGLPSITSCLQSFWEAQDQVAPRLQVPRGDEQQVLDLAAEFTPEEDEASTHNSSRRTTLLARRCCQHNTLAFLYGLTRSAMVHTSIDDREGDVVYSTELDSQELLARQVARIRGGQHTEYHPHLLRDTICLTSEPYTGSSLYAGGVRYFQSYTTSKGMFDSMKTFPFSHAGIAHLGYGMRQWDAVAAAAHIPTSRDAAKAALLQSRRRVNGVLKDRLNDTHGMRCELRMTTKLAAAVARAEEDWETLVVEASQVDGTTLLGLSDDAAEHASSSVTPSMDAFFAIPSRAFGNFLWANIHKHLLMMDSITAYYGNTDNVPEAAVATYRILALCLRHFTSTMQPAQAWIFNNSCEPARRPDGTTPRVGLGLRRTMYERGFGFLPDIINWDNFTLLERYMDRLVLPEERIRARGRRVRELQGANVMLDGLLSLLPKEHKKPKARALLLELIVHILLQDSRRVALTKLFPSMASYRRLVSDGGGDGDGRTTVEWTLQGLREAAALVDGTVTFQAMQGNRQLLKTPTDLFIWTWTREPARMSRKNIENLSFRVQCEQVRASLGGIDSVLDGEFMELLMRRFFEQHTAFSYPDSNGSFSQTTKSRARMLFCTTREMSRVVKMAVRNPVRSDQVIPPPAYILNATSMDIVRRMLAKL